MDELVTAERRTRSLTDADIDAIVAAMRHNCPNGMSPDDAAELRGFIAFLRKLKNAVGQAVIYGLLAVLATLFYLGIGKMRG